MHKWQCKCCKQINKDTLKCIACGTNAPIGGTHLREGVVMISSLIIGIIIIILVLS